jgi:prepilin-type N-terminal cleavage/methylation domain-containing protein
MQGQQQKGFTFIGLVIVLAILGVITLTVLKIFPVEKHP